MRDIEVPFCPKCHTQRDGTFCNQCGTPLVEGVRSCKCGYSNIWPHEKFCRECGAQTGPMPKLEDVTA